MLQHLSLLNDVSVVLLLDLNHCGLGKVCILNAEVPKVVPVLVKLVLHVHLLVVQLVLSLVVHLRVTL